MKILAAVVTVALALLGGSWWYARTLIPPTQHDPVSVVIADIQNNTNDPAFDRTLEPTLRRALEDATFVSAYDRTRIFATFGVRPGDKLDEESGRVIAVKQGLGVVLSGSIDPRGNGFEVSLRAVQAVTGDVVSSVRRRASSKEQVLEVVTRLASDVRSALGDETSDSDKLLAMKACPRRRWRSSVTTRRRWKANREARPTRRCKAWCSPPRWIRSLVSATRGWRRSLETSAGCRTPKGISRKRSVTLKG
jgi:hypothetical protein